MGKKNKKAKPAVGETESGMPRHVRREILELVNILLDKCSLPFGNQSSEWNDFLDVYKLVEKLRKKQQTYAMRRADRCEHMAEFVSWLSENGVDTSAVTIEQFPDVGFGLKTTRDIQESDIVLRIPRKLMLTTETAKTSVLGPLIEEDKILQTMPNVLMSLHLLCEVATPESFWAPYLQTLPDEYTTPLYFTPDEISLLKGSPAQSEIMNQFRNVTRQYAYFFRLFQGHTHATKLPIKNFCYDDYRWAASTVMTRQNQIPRISSAAEDSSEMDTALIPLWDMCNHTSGQISTDYNDQTNSSECYALRRFAAGEQFLIFYGPRSNAELLVHNGFIYDSNEHDKLALKLGVSKNDHLYSMKAEVLARIPLSPLRIYFLHANADEPVDSDLLAYLRVFAMDQDMLLLHLMGESAEMRRRKLRDFEHIVSAENETKAWAFLETRCQLLLRAYPTTAEEDDELLSKGNLSPHSLLAVKLRSGEKKILRSCQQYAASQKQSAVERAAAAEMASMPWDSSFNVTNVPASTGEEEFLRVNNVRVYGSTTEQQRAAVGSELPEKTAPEGDGRTAEMIKSQSVPDAVVDGVNALTVQDAEAVIAQEVAKISDSSLNSAV